MITPVIIGLGGIGSWFSFRYYLRDMADQLTPQNDSIARCKAFDHDIVERKNTKHQLYDVSEIGYPKAAIVDARYSTISGIMLRFGPEHLTDYNYYLICADNSAIRKLVFEHVLECNASGTRQKRFIDMRAEGKILSVFTDRCPKDILMGSLGPDPSSEQGFSCQLTDDVMIGRINCAFDAVGAIGMQIFMDDLRGEPIPPMVVHEVVIPAMPKVAA